MNQAPVNGLISMCTSQHTGISVHRTHTNEQANERVYWFEHPLSCFYTKYTATSKWQWNNYNGQLHIYSTHWFVRVWVNGIITQRLREASARWTAEWHCLTLWKIAYLIWFISWIIVGKMFVPFKWNWLYHRSGQSLCMWIWFTVCLPKTKFIELNVAYLRRWPNDSNRRSHTPVQMRWKHVVKSCDK